jgi:4-methylaminobutanoate oxidase (formaldehyde-forming)
VPAGLQRQAAARPTGRDSRRSWRARPARAGHADAEVTRLINGPEAFTPDNEFILGESAVRGYFVAAGFCAHGIAGAGGIGSRLARWIVSGEPELDLWKMDIRRFGSQYGSQA